MFGVSDVGGRKLLFHIYPDPPPPSLVTPSALADPWKVIEKEQNYLQAFGPLLCSFQKLKQPELK